MRSIALLILAMTFSANIASAAPQCNLRTYYSDIESRCLPAAPDENPNASEMPMTFIMRQMGIRPELTWIGAEGIITADTPATFAAFLKNSRVYKENRIEFHSAGGSLYGGMELGRLIREAGLSTTIGRSIRLDNPDFSMDIYQYDRAFCLSACAYALLGGEARWLPDDASYGVHRFGSRFFQISPDEAQTVSSDVARYLEEMGIDQRLFQIASRVDFNGDILFIDRATAAALRVTFDPSARSSRFDVELLGENIVANSRIFHKGHEYNLRIHCIDKYPRLVVWGHSDTFPQIFHDLPNGLARFYSGDQEIITHVTSGLVGNGNAFATFDARQIVPALIRFRNLRLDMVWPPDWEQKDFFDKVRWTDMASWFAFEFSPENPSDALDIVMRQC